MADVERDTRGRLRAAQELGKRIGDTAANLLCSLPMCSAYEAITGNKGSSIVGEKLEAKDRVLAGAGVGVPIGVVKHADEVEGASAGIARGAKEAEEAAIAVKAERRTSTLKRAGDGPGYAATRTASAERIFADMDKWSLAPLSDRQKQMILDKLGAVKQRSSALGEAVRKGGFSKADERKVIAEWERQTGMKWPAGATPHHAIPIKNGGAVDQWWNIIPVKNPHTGTIHGTGSALRTELPYEIEPGTITSIK